MSVKELKCPKCGASISPEKHVCGYCGTYYVIEGNIAYTLDSRPATDENLERYLKRTKMHTDHLEETGHYRRIISEEEFSRYAFMARDHLRKELGREPTIAEVDKRTYIYVNPVKNQRLQSEIDREALIAILFMLGVPLILAVIWFFWILPSTW